MNIYKTIQHDADALYEQLVAWRRDFHQHPEVGFTETRTAAIVADHLRNLGLETSTGVGQTGVVALIEPDDFDESGRTVMLRFDMDALPIHEINDVPYRSQSEGAMHACGHDGHTAIGMGVAKLLSQHRNGLGGRVKLVFQPGEEGCGGAAAMIEDGVLENPAPDAAFALHLWNQLPLNQVVVQAGPLWASAGFFRLVVRGKGGHGAMPHETVDATLVASQIVVNWQSIVARSVDPARTAVLSVGTFHSGEVKNAISERAELTGTIRSFDDEVQRLLMQRMQEVADGLCTAYGATCELDFPFSTPATVNAEAETEVMQRVAEQMVDPAQIARIEPMMVGEDMADFLARVPGCFILVGAGGENGEGYAPHHNPAFDFDERMMPTGVALLAGAAVEYLAQHGPA